MSISNIQYNTKRDEFKQQLLKKGIEPNNFELNNLLIEFFDNKTLGMPYYSPILQEAYEASNKEAYNNTFKSLEEDLNTIYNANIETNNKSVAIQEYYNSEQTKAVNSIQKLSLRLKNIKDIMNTYISGKQYVEVFNDLYGIEFYGNSERNIPYTTSFIDLLQKKVYTDKSNSKVNKINIQHAYVEISTTSCENKIIKGSIANILNDTLDSTYSLVCRSVNNKDKTCSITLNLKKAMTINTVLLKYNSSRGVLCRLYLSEDGENFVPVHDITNSNLVEWNFPQQTIQYLRIDMIKNEPDGSYIVEGKEMYEYYYILKNISIALETFNSKSVLVSKPIEFNDLVNSITINAEDRIYNNTRIDYFIGFDNGTAPVGWDSIENHKEHELFMFEHKNKILNYSTKDVFGIQDWVSNLYMIYKIPDTVNRNSIKLTAGYNMWSVIRYQTKQDQEYDSSFTFKSFDFTEYTDNCVADQLFMDCENYKSFVLHPNTLYVFTQYVYLDEPKNLYNKYIRIYDTGLANYIANTEQKVFLNGIEISKTGDDGENYYSFAMKKGANKVQIVIYAPAKSGAGTDRLLYHNLNFKELTNDVFAFTPMKYVNWYVLDKQLEPNYRYYTIKNNRILVKCDPEDMINSEMEDMGYFLSYYSLKEDMQYYFENNKMRFRIMAILSSDDYNVSPEIVNFRITGK